MHTGGRLHKLHKVKGNGEIWFWRLSRLHFSALKSFSHKMMKGDGVWSRQTDIQIDRLKPAGKDSKDTSMNTTYIALSSVTLKLSTFSKKYEPKALECLPY